MVASSLLALLAALVLVGLAILARYLTGSWLAPGSFFALYWAFETLLPILVLSRDKVSVHAVLWVGISVLVVLVGSLVGSGMLQGDRFTHTLKPVSARISLVSVLVIGCVFLGMGSSIVSLFSAGYGLDVFRSASSLVSVAHYFSVGRYSYAYTPPLLAQAFLVFVYVGPLLGGLLAAAGGRRYWGIAILSILPGLMMTITQTQRAVMLAASTLWVSAYLAARRLLGQRNLFTQQHVLAGLVGMGLLFALGVGAGLARLGTTDVSLLGPVVLPKVYDGIFGHMAVFSTWVENRGLTANSLSWGAYTFAGLFNALGLHERQPGLFVEAVVLASGDTSNLYTIFRPLVEDYTALGSLVVLFGLGLLAGGAYQKVVQGRSRYLPVLTAFYATTLCSFATCIWTYNSIIVAALLFGMCFWIIPRFVRLGYREP